MHKLFYLIILIAAVFRLFFFFEYHEVWWDSGAYIGMGKYIFSGGNAGLWEDIRPVVWPIVLGFGWWIGLDAELFGRVITLFLSLGSIFLVYIIAKKIFGECAALFSTAIFALSPIFFYLGFHTYTEIPSLFLLLISFYFIIGSHPALAGIFTGLSTLTRFPMGIFVIPAAAYMLFQPKNRKLNTMIFFGFFAAALLPFLIFNFIMYGDFFATFNAAAAAIKQVLGCNVLRFEPWTAYLKWLFFSENPLHMFAVVGLLYLFARKDHAQYFITASAVIPLIYYSQMHCRDYRYLLSFLPFVTMLGGYGIKIAAETFLSRLKKKVLFCHLVLLVILAFSVWQGLLFYNGNEIPTPDAAALGYFAFLKDKQVSGEIWTANPVAAAYTDQKYEKLYYPVYHEKQYANFYEYLSANPQKIGAIFLDNCGGGIICHPEDNACKQQTHETINFLLKNFRMSYNKSTGNCWYTVFTSWSL